MQLTKHAQARADQRTISKEEILFLQDFGDVTYQKGGVCVLTVFRDSVPHLLGRLEAALECILLGQVDGKKIRRKTRQLKKLINSISAEHPPYFVLGSDEKVITCGHQFKSLRNKNKQGLDNYV